LELLSKYTSLITLITVIFGWIIVNWQNNRREERKEVRSSLSSIIEEITSIEDLATTYHSADSRDRDNEKLINQKITRLSAKIRHLRFESIEVNNLFIELKKSITLDNFETSKFIQQSPHSEIIDSINLYSEQLQDLLETEFSNNFRGTFLDRLAASIKRFRSASRPYPRKN
jgi:hypothetical protein